MSVIPALNDRFEEIGAVLKALREMEKRQSSNRRSFHEKGRLITSTRASVYIMIYNAIEAAMRAAVSNLRDKIQQENVGFTAAAEFWRLDAIQAKFLHKMSTGTNHGNLLVDLVPMTGVGLSWDDEDRQRLPFSGNFGQKSAIRLRDQLGLNWSPPAATLGGADLENIRKRRNALAHGLETFQQAGSQTTAETLQHALGRVRVFMVSYIEAIEAYGTQKNYLTQLPLPIVTDEDLEEIQDSYAAEPPQSVL